MSIKTVKFYEVGDSFDAEGKGPHEVIGRFWEQPESDKFAKGRGNYGKDAQVKPVTLIIADTCEDMDNYRDEELRQKALKKLTDEEKRVLNLHYLD